MEFALNQKQNIKKQKTYIFSLSIKSFCCKLVFIVHLSIT